MAKKRTTSAKKSPAGRSRRGALVCPECGFKAAHAMGLGRHRSARHGVVSQRQLAGRRSSAPRRGTDAALQRRVADLEQRYDKLLKGLAGVLARASR